MFLHWQRTPQTARDPSFYTMLDHFSTGGGQPGIEEVEFALHFSKNEGFERVVRNRVTRFSPVAQQTFACPFPGPANRREDVEMRSRME